MNTILHLGVGAFHRAHQAAYMQRLRQLGERRWRLVGGNIRDEAKIRVLSGSHSCLAWAGALPGAVTFMKPSKTRDCTAWPCATSPTSFRA